MATLKRRSASPASSKKPTTVEQYLAALPERTRSDFLKLRELVRAAAPPEAVEVISYGIPALKQKRVLVWYAAFANHTSLFPTAAVLEAFKDELQGFKTSKGTIQFPAGKRLPVGLINKLVKARIVQQKN